VPNVQQMVNVLQVKNQIASSSRSGLDARCTQQCLDNRRGVEFSGANRPSEIDEELTLRAYQDPLVSEAFIAVWGSVPNTATRLCPQSFP
jgi:hypothetical protein